MADAIKRLHYFDHQFLREKDFTDEQDYHIGMRRRHNQLLHTWGIAEGLRLSFVSGASRVTVSPGVAVNGQGQEIVLPASTQTADLSGAAGRTVFVTIAYDEQQTDATSETGETNNTRWTETPRIETSESAPTDPSQRLVLGRVTVAANGEIGGIDEGVEPNRRRAAGVVGGDIEVRSLALTDPGVASTQWPRLRLGVANRADLQSHLRVSGNIEVTGTVDSRDVSADGTRLDTHVGITSGNPHGTTAAQVGALPIAGGTLTGNLQVNGNIGVTGTVDSRDVSADGTRLDAHVGITSGNPHGTTAAQVGALTITGGTLTGNLQVNGNIGVTGTVDSRDVSADGTRLDAHVGITSGNPHGSTAAQVGALSTAGGSITGSLSTTFSGGSNFPAVMVWHGAADAIWGILARVTPTLASSPGARGAAVAGVADIDGVHGVYAAARAGTHALFVQGTAQFTGAKSGYVVDIFVNASGQRLRTGDVVKLKGTPVTQFQGDYGKIPVTEVTLADQENDTMVIGVVDREAIPEQDAPDTRVGADDPTFIEDGGTLYVVTLGAYAHCKVDATVAPIQVGDLLTSSSNPGHAKKATSPTIGSTIGKALEPLQEGTGYIAIFVNNQ